MTNLAIIIISWNVRDLLAECLRSVQNDLSSSQLSRQIWVVDNASRDDSAAMVRRQFPDVRLIASKKNLGFAGGNNAALRAMGFAGDETKPPIPASQRDPEPPEVVLLLNPDTVVHPGALQTLYRFLKSTPRAGIAGAKLVYSDGSFQHGAFAFPGLWQLAIELLPLPGRLAESRWNGRYGQSLYESQQPFRIDHPLGAAMAVKREAIEQAGLLDEAYHMYVEEVDWSKRITAAGWAAYCVPTAVVTHFGGQSTGQIKTNSFVTLWRSRYRFYRKYCSPVKFWLAQQIVRIGMRRQLKTDTEANVQGKLSEKERLERLAGYKQIVNIWQEREICQN